MRRARWCREAALGNSVGVAEHCPYIALSRPRVLTVALVVALAYIPTAVGAQSTDDKIAATRAAINDLAVEWFQHQAEADQLDAQIDELEQRVTAAQTRAVEAAAVAQDHAVEIYKGSGSDSAISPVLDGTDALDSARRAELFDRASAESRDAIDELNAASEDLDRQREELEQRRNDQDEVAASLKTQQEALEAQLAALQKEAAAEDAAAAKASAAQEAAPAPRPIANEAAPAPTPATTNIAAVSAPATGGTHPQHDHPFLVCTRDRESRGDYTAVNSSGYYGAYQFAPTTWDVTANYAGRLDLVGVLPSRASAYDQDHLAWTLYQWQGNSPWGGRC
jgi:peptidoglycan hydrolase CwlO-like protein